MKKIVVACGSGIATSTTVASAIKDMCADARIPVQVESIDLKNIENEIQGADIYVGIVNAVEIEKTGAKYGIPTINGIPFLTGVGIDDEFEKLCTYLKNKK